MRMKKTTRKQLRTIRRRRLALALVGAMAMPAALAQSLPSGYTVVNGDPTIGSVGTQMTVTQTTKGAIIDWGSFNIGAGYGVTFDQQFGASSVTLNRVVGFGYSTSASQIDGTLTSNGNVFIINPAGITFSYPPAAEGTAVTLDAAGGDYSAFTLEAPGIAPLVLAADSYPISSSQPLSFSWTPAAEPSKSHILVHLDISHHGGSKGKIECDTADDGALQINASLMSQLLALGVAGYPTVTVTRRATGEVTIAPGRVTFNIQQNVERAITVEGVTSCTSDADCTGGMTCASDLTCQ